MTIGPQKFENQYIHSITGPQEEILKETLLNLRPVYFRLE
jgi:hypothetical protein